MNTQTEAVTGSSTKTDKSAVHVAGGLLVTLIGIFGFLASIAIGSGLAVGLVSIFGALIGGPWLTYGAWLLAKNIDRAAGQ